MSYIWFSKLNLTILERCIEWINRFIVHSLLCTKLKHWEMEKIVNWKFYLSILYLKKQTDDRPQENIAVQKRPAAPISENVHIFFNTDLSTVSRIKMTKHNTEYLAKTRNENSLKWSVMLCTTLTFLSVAANLPVREGLKHWNNHSSITGQIARSSLIACETDFFSYGFLWLIWHYLCDFIFELKLDFLVISWKDK